VNTMNIARLVALMVLGSVSQPHAQDTSAPVFTCALGKKTVAVTQAGGQLTYHYGVNGKDEMAIVGVPSAGNVFQMSQRFAGMEYQLRFTNGDYSYIVYESEGSSRVGAASTSGLVIMQGTKRISDRSCSRFAEFAAPVDSFGIPEDTGVYSAL
jgi:hypothetical protein